MAVAEVGLGAVPSELVAEHWALYVPSHGEVVNRVGTDEDTSFFLDGIEEFDVRSGSSPRWVKHTDRYEEGGVLVRSMIHRRNSMERPIASSVLQLLEDHPLYDPTAVYQFAFEGHIAPDSPDQRVDPRTLIRPGRAQLMGFIALGKYKAATS